MVGSARSNFPEGKHLAPVKVRKLQNRLWATAKQSKSRAFHALFDRIYGSDVLWEAWERVRANRGAAGVDALTIAAVEAYGAERMIAELQSKLRAGKYHPAPVRRVEIPKPDGSKRPLGIPTVTDRVCQQAAKLVLEPIFEADFLDCSFGFRPKRSALDAMEAIRVGFIAGNQFVFEADISDFFGSIDHERLLSLVGEQQASHSSKSAHLPKETDTDAGKSESAPARRWTDRSIPSRQFDYCLLPHEGCLLSTRGVPWQG